MSHYHLDAQQDCANHENFHFMKPAHMGGEETRGITVPGSNLVIYLQENFIGKAITSIFYGPADMCKSINTIALKMVKVSQLVQRKLIPYRSNIGSEAFRKIKYFGNIQDGYSVYTDLTIKSKFLKNTFHSLPYSQYKSHR